MFVLRRINSQGIEMNFNLGDSYVLVRKDQNQKEFDRAFIKLHLESDDFNLPIPDVWKDLYEQTIAFISCFDGSKTHSIYGNQKNFIMNNLGNTFSKIN